MASSTARKPRNPKPPEFNTSELATLATIKRYDGEATRKDHGLPYFHVRVLLERGAVKITGKVETGQRGRPAFKFGVAPKGNRRLRDAKRRGTVA